MHGNGTRRKENKIKLRKGNTGISLSRGILGAPES